MVAAIDRSYERLAVNAVWLLRLRWVAVVGQLVTIGVASLILRVELEFLPLLTIVAFTAATNAVFYVWLHTHAGRHETQADAQRDQRVLVVVMTLDLLSLTALLYFSGGPANPFVIFYLVNLSLAAVVLPARWGWSLTLLAIVCLSALCLDHVALPELQQPLPSALAMVRPPTLQQLGFVVAMAACGGVAVYFITRVTRELQHREEDLRVAEQQRARSERLEALATLAAGAGHELASPLSTIAVIAKDLTQHLEGTEVPQSVIDDVRLIRSELDHCRRILDEMSSSAGQVTGEEMRPVRVRQLVDEMLQGLRRRDRVRVAGDEPAMEENIVVPLVGTAQAIRGVVRNALDASEPAAQVDVSVSLEPDYVRIRIVDHGSGMPREVLLRAAEPFFTTKEPGKGMGLGLFLVHNVINRLQGDFHLESTVGEGTTATIRLRRQAPPRAESE